MFWDRIAWAYDVFANLINKKTHESLKREIGKWISETDEVLECACGTGLLSGRIAEKCKHIIATDFSEKMLDKARKKYHQYQNIEFRWGDIMNIEFPDHHFDVVVAANVIHLLDEPLLALAELTRVCKPGGTLLIPTYVKKKSKGNTPLFTRLIGKSGAHFKKQFTFESYQDFFKETGFANIEFTLVDGRIPCALAVIHL